MSDYKLEESYEKLNQDIKVEYVETLNDDIIHKQIKKRGTMLIIVIMLFVIVGTTYLIQKQIRESNQENNLFLKKEFERIVNYIIENNYNNLTFNGNEVIIPLEDLYEGTHGVKLEPNFFDNDGHQCLGYLWVIKDNDAYEIDSSHYCDRYD